MLRPAFHPLRRDCAEILYRWASRAEGGAGVSLLASTNNVAERALRSCVLMRKTSFGTHSEDGSRFIERMLTVAATLRQQKRNVVDYVTDAVERSLKGQSVPSLLPIKSL